MNYPDNSTTDFMVERSLPQIQTDANGKTTALVYDAVGRLKDVYRPSETPLVDIASMRFFYDIDAERDDPAVIQTQVLVDDSPVTYQDAWVVYDGLLRQRQTHALSPDVDEVLAQPGHRRHLLRRQR